MMNHSNGNTQVVCKRIVIAGVLVSLALQGTAANATTQCFDFEDPPLGTEYPVGGAPIYTDFATIRVQPFSVDGVLLPPEDGSTEIVSSNLPSFTPPSLEITSATVQVALDTPAEKVTFDYAQNTGLADLQRQNFGVNGERRTDVIGGLEQLSGEELGDPALGGSAGIAMNATPDDPVPPTWVRGTATIWALEQGISVFSVGGHRTMFIDNVCATS